MRLATREELIERAAEDAYKANGLVSRHEYFIQGAEWADANPIRKTPTEVLKMMLENLPEEIDSVICRYRAALQKIADIGSAGPDRPSFGDWELRQLAREALEAE